VLFVLLELSLELTTIGRIEETITVFLVILPISFKTITFPVEVLTLPMTLTLLPLTDV
jgi:hypothetical protein